MSHSCNSPGAQYNLGVLYENSHGVDQSESMAMRWYAKAAAQGHEKAQARITGILAKHRASSAAAAAASSTTSGGENEQEKKQGKKKGKKKKKKKAGGSKKKGDC